MPARSAARRMSATSRYGTTLLLTATMAACTAAVGAPRRPAADPAALPRHTAVPHRAAGPAAAASAGRTAMPGAIRQAGATAGTPPATPAPRWTLVGLGDSVPAGTACGCAGFVALYGSWLASAYGARVSTVNLSVPGLTSAGLRTLLDGDGAAAAAVARADIVTLTIGANDFGYGQYSPAGCPDLACYAAGLLALRANVAAVLARIRALRRGAPTAVRVTDYWEIWLDGRVGRAHGAQYMAVGDALTRRVNAVLAAAARSAGVGFVDIYRAFRGADGSRDDTDLLAPDGDHPDAAGHAVIATALSASGLAPLR